MASNANNRSKQTNGSAPTPARNRLSTIRGRVTKQNTTEYCLVDANSVLMAISFVQAVGGLISFGSTRDGGALVISVLDGRENEKFYCKDAGECNDTLNDIVEAFKPDIIPEVTAHIINSIRKE